MPLYLRETTVCEEPKVGAFLMIYATGVTSTYIPADGAEQLNTKP